MNLIKILLIFLISFNAISARINSRIGSTDWFVQVQKGKIQGHRIQHLFSHNESVGTTAEDIWFVGGVKTFLTTASTIEAISDNANDTLVGTGARVITVTCLDSSWNEITQDLNMNGLTVTTATPTACIRINFAKVKETGTYGGANAGTITVRVSGAGATQLVIGIDNDIPSGKSFGSHFTCPAAKKCYVLEYEVIAAANKEANIHFMKREGADIIIAPFKPLVSESIEDGISGPNGHDPVSPEKALPEKTDIWFKAVLPSGTGGITVNYEVLIIDV